MHIDLDKVSIPYAKAIFELALKKQILDDWLNIFAKLELVMENGLKNYIYNPQLTLEMVLDVFTSSLEKKEMKIAEPLIILLYKNKRLNALKQVSENFNKLYAKEKKIKEIEVCTAIPMEQNHREILFSKLHKKFKGEELKITYKISSSLIGGAILRYGDKVIDGSIRTKLNNMCVGI